MFFNLVLFYTGILKNILLFSLFACNDAFLYEMHSLSDFCRKTIVKVPLKIFD